jgi:hypothetical protein
MKFGVNSRANMPYPYCRKGLIFNQLTGNGFNRIPCHGGDCRSDVETNSLDRL